VLGVLDGPLDAWAVARAVLALRGRPTANLRVRLRGDARLGDRVLPAGTVVDTGLDVPPGTLVPLGLRVGFARGRVRAGVTCALCHAAVEPTTGRILEGAPNADLETGLVLALASNSAAIFRATGVRPDAVPADGTPYRDADGGERRLPSPEALEAAVDADLAAWPPGSFDSTADLVNDPTQIPSSYTQGAWPYGWSGFAGLGWFHGLTTLNNDVHAVYSDPTTGAESSAALLGIDRERYLGTILQRAAHRRYRLPAGARPSEFLAGVDPTAGLPAINRVIPMPGYPKGSPFALDGLLASRPGRPVGEALNGMSAWQNTLAPPPRDDAVAGALLATGADVFTRAGCVGCHAGRWLTSNAVVAVGAVGTQPARAAALAAFPRTFVAPRTYRPDVLAPPPPDAPTLPVPDADPVPGWRRLAYAQDGQGGYKVPSLVGLAVTAPYLHDGGVAAPAAAVDRAGRTRDDVPVGLPATLLQGLRADPRASLHALVDRGLRARVVEANRAEPRLRRANVDGSGHAFWADAEAGVDDAARVALIEFLLSLDDAPAVLPAPADAARR